ncbi:MAG: NADH-quinone oxidoreductase subunit A [Bacteroidota bacterium]|nr:NADH-quinone oxidoreductase subunit A [Bacteroidota bacterium]
MGSGSLILLMFCGILFAGLAIGLGKVFSIKTYNTEKGEAYECGIQTEGTTWVQFNVGYYLFSLIFLVFDVEIVFLYPWAVVLKEIGMVAFTEILIFSLFLFMGLLYAYKKKALTWV